MDWDDEFDGEFDEMPRGAHRDNPMTGEDSVGRLDPMDITNPASAYFLLSDDAQDEIAGTDKKKMKCRFCGNRFVGQIYDRRPECFSSDTEEVIDQRDDGYW